MTKRERDRGRIMSLTIVGLLVVSFFLGERAYLGAAVVAIPVLVYIQYARWKDGARFF